MDDGAFDWLTNKAEAPGLQPSPFNCKRCEDRRGLYHAGAIRPTACPDCSVRCPECDGWGGHRGEEGPDPCNVCAGTGFALKKK